MKRHASVRRLPGPQPHAIKESRQPIDEAFDEVTLSSAKPAAQPSPQVSQSAGTANNTSTRAVSAGWRGQTRGSYSRSQERLTTDLLPSRGNSLLSTTSLPATDRSDTLEFPERQAGSDHDTVSLEDTSIDEDDPAPQASSFSEAQGRADDQPGAVPQPPVLHSHRTRAQRHAVVREMVADMRPVLDGRIESLPVSAQKSAVLSCTRPSHLPPKSRKEEKKHLTQYEQLLRKSLKHEDSDHRRQARLVARKARHLAANADEWEKHILPNFQTAIKQSRTRAMWWDGLPLRVRGRIWAKCIGNTLDATPDTFATALRNARTAEADLLGRRDRGEDDSQELLTLASFTVLRDSMAGAFASLRLFQLGGPLHGALRDVLLAYRFYRADIEYHVGVASVAALLLLNLPPPAAFIALVNLMNRTLLLAVHTRDKTTVERKLDHFPDLLAKRLPALHEHLFTTLRLSSTALLEPLLRSLFTQQAPVDVAARIWDIYLFEGDTHLMKICLCVLEVLETALYGTHEEVMAILNAEDPLRIWHTRFVEDDFVERLRRI